MDYVQGAAGGFNTGLTSLLGLPGNIIAAATSGEPTNPVQNLFGDNMVTRGVDAALDAPRRAANAFGEYIGSQNLQRSADATVGRLTQSGTMFPKGPDTTGGRIINRVGQEIGAAAIPAAAILRAGSYVAPAMRPAPTLAQTILDPISRSPGRAAIGETAAAAGAGVGAGAMREAYPGSTVAETWGQLIGGFTPSVIANTPTAIVGRTAQALRGNFSAEARREAARRTIGDYLGSELSTQQTDNLRAADRIAEQIPGFNPTLAERTGSPGLVRKQAEIDSQLSGADLDQSIMRRQDDQAAIGRFAASQAPEASIGPEIVVDTARRRVDDLRGGAESLTRIP
jgi:hypothetical protein